MMDLADAVSLPLERTISQQSATSLRSHRSGTLRGNKTRKLISQPSSSASSIIAPSDKSLTSFPSFSGDPSSSSNFDYERERYFRTTAQDLGNGRRGRDASGRSPTITVPGALHKTDDGHIERLIARHGAVALVRQIAGDLAQRDAQISVLRRRADERERALRKIIRECGLSNLDLETRLRAVETELKENGTMRTNGSGLSDLMSDAMQDTMVENAYGETDATGSTIRATSASLGNNPENGKGTMKGWKDYIWGGGTSKRSSMNGDGSGRSSVIRAQPNSDRRPILADDLFDPPANVAADTGSIRSSSRASSAHSTNPTDRKGSASLASLALRLVAGGAIASRDGEPRGRAVSSTGRPESTRAGSVASNNTNRSGRAVSVAGGPKALMAMRRSTPAPSAPSAPPSTKSQAQEMWGNMVGSPPGNSTLRQESYGPVEMDAILPPELQPPTLTQMYNNYPNCEYLTDRFGFIYDQRRKKRQREAAQMAQHVRKGSRTEMLTNGRTGVSPNTMEDLPSPKWSVSSDQGRPESPSSLEERMADEVRAKRWQDYLRIATFPTELLSHTPGISASAVVVTEGSEQSQQHSPIEVTTRSPAITPTQSGLMPLASTTTAIDNDTKQSSEQDSTIGTLVKEDAEPVKLLLQQLSDMHDVLQRDKTVRWNDFLRKVRAERRREGEAAVAAAAAAAEARFERPSVILPESRVADGEMIGISNLGNKGKVGRAKWNEFKNLVLGGIPVAYRAKVWSECSGATALRVPGYYDDLVSQNGESDDPTVVSQIGMDIHRTLTDNIFFRKGPGVKKLNEVLLAYSRRNKDVGYCQGMNLITANLLLITPSAEDAFWILTSIIENILPHGYYDHSLISSRADQQVLRQYVKTVLPKLSAHLDSLSIELEALTFQWFLSVFTDCLCAEALFRVWDVVLCTNDGSTFLFQVALALLKLNESNLLQCDTPAGIYTYINHQMTEHAISIDGLIQASEGLRRVVRREDVESRRDKAMQAEKDMLAERDDAAGTTNKPNPADVGIINTAEDEDNGGAVLTTESQTVDA
ncbi:TBC domain-containing protein C4G8.04 [Cladobotryum mycophilum]|uniref:TBC domain-containing protein C4G8.04 n=1 Tax=Cladobotryum mycophilum TaxID=491253 RepID=A0ABR0T016_9HYPO